MRKLFGPCVLMLCFGAGRSSAQSAKAAEYHCIRIKVALNGASLEGPRSIVFQSKQGDSTASLEHGCFRVPEPFLAEKKLGISFTIVGNQIYIPAVATGFFTGEWNIELEDKEIRDKTIFPNHTLAREACVVVFHTGDEPERAISVIRCRSPFPKKHSD